MQGLKTQESNKFNSFFELVQKEANNQGAIFFLEAGDGRDFETDAFEGEDLQGWLIPNDKVDEFEVQWVNDEIDEKWQRFFCFAVWHQCDDRIKITFE